MSAPTGVVPAIEARGIVNRFGAQVVHDGLDMTVRQGEVFGIVGGSGTGKSVLLRTILGLHRPQAGEVRIFGTDLTRLSDAELRAVKASYGVTFQAGALFSSLTVLQNVQLPMLEHLSLPPRALEELAMLKVRLVGLSPEAAAKYPAQLSGGMVKRAALARALALDPKLLFCDEPTAGLDPTRVTEFDELTLKLCKDLGVTAVVVTHDMTSAFRIGTRMILLNKGKIWAVGTPDEIRAHPDPGVKRFINGDPESEVRQDADSYLKDILGESK